jgi:excisionase family DNA binding protein
MSKPLGTKEAADYLGITAGALYMLVYRGQIPCYKPYGKLRFKQEELEAFIFSNRRATDKELAEQAEAVLNVRGRPQG